MILTDRDIAYIKIPRTGSTTLHNALTGALSRAGIAYVDALDINRQLGRGKYWGRHLRVSDMQAILGDRFDRMQFFTTIREPLERLFSVYRWQHSKEPDNPCHASFDTFMRAVWAADERLRRQGRLHAQPQARWLRDDGGNIPLDRLLLIPGDRQTAFYPKLSKLVGAELVPTERVNVSSGEPELVISPRVEREIHRRYRADFALWGRVESNAIRWMAIRSIPQLRRIRNDGARTFRAAGDRMRRIRRTRG